MAQFEADGVVPANTSEFDRALRTLQLLSRVHDHIEHRVRQIALFARKVNSRR